jgi:hypothetical protein
MLRFMPIYAYLATIMKQYVIDELRPDDHQKLKEYLDANHAAAGFDGLFWMLLEEQMLEAIQKEHSDCQPFYFALELFPDRLACELLVRTNQRSRCQCIQYASERQRNWLVQAVDSIFTALEITA